MKFIFIAVTVLLAIACKNEKEKTGTVITVQEKAENTINRPSNSTKKIDHQLRSIAKSEKAPAIDGIGDDEAWKNADWCKLDQKWIGAAYSPEDFSGRYKLTWTPEALYLLVEITDDILYDEHPDPLTLWWDDDCVEIFIDEDNSGGSHQFTHNAFAYHVALDTKNVVDMSPTTKSGALYNEHVNTKKVTKGTTTVWEHKILVYNDQYVDGEPNKPVQLHPNKKIGFALAYCDNDASKMRENFIGSVFVPGEDKNKGYIDANIFGTIILQN